MPFSVVTYNVANLGPDSSSRIHFITRNLLRSGCDVACLQEVSSHTGALERLASELQGSLPHLSHSAGNDPRGMNVAILSRWPLIRAFSHADLEFRVVEGDRRTRFSRDLLRVDLEKDGQTWTIYNAHLKSMRGGASARLQRRSEAATIARLVAEQMQETSLFVLAGDFNDERTSPAVESLHGGVWDLRNSLEVMPARRTLTFPCRGPRHQFDYILFPAHLLGRFRESRVWPESRASDHAMVSARWD